MNTRVLVFDSGVGGLSILKEIRQQLPSLSLYYLMDNAAFPYGTKADDFLIHRILTVIRAAVQTLQPDLLVIACNTASTLALSQLRQTLSIPVVGVVPAIKVAASLPDAHHIGLLATPATVQRAYTDQLIADFGQGKSIQKFGSSLLVEMAEHWINQQQAPDLTALQQHLSVWFNQTPALTHVVLGCTHFPLLQPELSQLWPHIVWVDSSAAIARRVASLLPQPSDASLGLYWTDPSQPPAGVAKFLHSLGELKHYQALPL